VDVQVIQNPIEIWFLVYLMDLTGLGGFSGGLVFFSGKY
jgi:hypothetical protein